MQNGPAYCQAFLNVLRNVTKEEAVQYVLALIDDMLSGKCCLSVCSTCSVQPWMTASDSSSKCHASHAVDPARAQLFHQESDVHLATLPDPYGIFLR